MYAASPTGKPERRSRPAWSTLPVRWSFSLTLRWRYTIALRSKAKTKATASSDHILYAMCACRRPSCILMDGLMRITAGRESIWYSLARGEDCMGVSPIHTWGYLLATPSRLVGCDIVLTGEQESCQSWSTSVIPHENKKKDTVRRSHLLVERLRHREWVSNQAEYRQETC